MYIRPNTVQEAIDALAATGGRILSGGTDFFPALGDRPASGAVIDISALSELKGIERQADHWRIGARTTWRDLIAAALPPAFDGLKAAAAEVGGRQIQNVGTIGGNLCNASPAADGVPPLLALDGEVELAGRGGLRRLPLADFILGSRRTALEPGEILAAIRIPAAGEQTASSFLKLGARRYLVISIAMVAVVIDLDGQGRVAAARIAVGACSAVARRLPRTEQALAGADARADLGRLILPDQLDALAPIDDLRAPASYRRDAALILVRRAVEACLDRREHA